MLAPGLLFATHCFAESPIQPLHTDPVWLTLGHYQQAMTGGYTSQADDPDFFLSPAGKHSPKDELDATLRAIQADGEGDSHARCQFPARAAWLQQQFQLELPPMACPAFDQWTATLNAEHVTLVFAASYLNSPSSMFGHTFLRLDPPQDDASTNLLLANTISYAADAAAHDNELLFAYKGIFGGYPGVTSVEPYYEKIRLYSDIEHRDLWEYRLNLRPAEVARLLAHTWEIRNRNFDYYFFDENCAYRLLALIDAARPGTDLIGEVSTHAIPSDTVRWVVAKDLVAEVHYRPSAATSVSYALGQLPVAQQRLAVALARGALSVNAPDVAALEPADKARLFDATYDYVRYQSAAKKWPREHAAPVSHDLLVARSQISATTATSEPTVPAVRDDQGHNTFRASVAAGRRADRNFTQLTLRPAYHDLLDPPAGYRHGAELEFLRVDARYYTDNQSLELEQLTGVAIRSLSTRNAFFQPLSWQVGFGGRRTDTGSKRVLAPYLEGGVGGSWALGSNTQAFALATVDAEIDDDLNKGYDLGPGADLGLVFQHHTVSALAGVKRKAWLVDNLQRQDQLYVHTNWHLSRAVSAFAAFTREHHFDRYHTLWHVGLHVYF
ncbi:hypothetical protein BG841_03465 [Marinobacter sp. X15-166B]|nr:hypothetical protein BG841_03465 [Marinobacter sp. X15-166B]